MYCKLDNEFLSFFVKFFLVCEILFEIILLKLSNYTYIIKCILINFNELD